MDFVVMDTADSASALYHGMTLPIPEGEAKERGGRSYGFYSVENETLYAAKVRVGDTVVYASARAEDQQEVVGILEAPGYWEEQD